MLPIEIDTGLMVTIPPAGLAISMIGKSPSPIETLKRSELSAQDVIKIKKRKNKLPVFKKQILFFIKVILKFIRASFGAPISLQMYLR
ncbi:MAG: hypothetical protein DHS20C18_29790 [Saprospiraceae bacterium]|nr:MAG: hypothetical protein DHS20C18_29790 [Saprospiraceae bacterium]